MKYSSCHLTIYFFCHVFNTTQLFFINKILYSHRLVRTVKHQTKQLQIDNLLIYAFFYSKQKKKIECLWLNQLTSIKITLRSPFGDTC